MCSHQMGPNWPSAKLAIYRVRQWRCDKISKSIFSGMDNDFELKFDTLIDPSLVKTLTNFCGDNFNHLREKWFFPMPLKIYLRPKKNEKCADCSILLWQNDIIHSADIFYQGTSMYHSSQHKILLRNSLLSWSYYDFTEPTNRTFSLKNGKCPFSVFQGKNLHNYKQQLWKIGLNFTICMIACLSAEI